MGRNSLEQLALFNLEPIIEKNTLTQVCNTCKKELPLSYFNTKGKFKEQNKKYSYLDKTCKSCDSIERGERKLREKKYGMPSKNYCCPICERNEQQIKNNLIKVDENRNVVVRDFKFPIWVIDHDHEHGYFRGFLCNSCNTGLGAIGDDKKSVNKVLKYLEKAEKNKNVTSFKKSVDNKI